MARSPRYADKDYRGDGPDNEEVERIYHSASQGMSSRVLTRSDRLALKDRLIARRRRPVWRPTGGWPT